ncbi:MAG: hypothetical protein V1866_00565 [archaeon]
MIGNPLEQDIIELYSDNISSIYSINQIAGKLGKKYPYINKKVSLLIKNRIFKKIVVGRSYLCSLNLRNDETIYLLILNEIKRKKAELEAHPKLQGTMDYLDKVKKTIPIQLVIKSKENLFFVFEGSDDKERFEKGTFKQLFSHYQMEALTKESFLAMLVEDKDIQENHIILHGFEKYYAYLKEIETELNLKYSKLMP